jgi:hypothetical protein
MDTYGTIARTPPKQGADGTRQDSPPDTEVRPRSELIEEDGEGASYPPLATHIFTYGGFRPATAGSLAPRMKQASGDGKGDPDRDPKTMPFDCIFLLVPILLAILLAILVKFFIRNGGGGDDGDKTAH